MSHHNLIPRVAVVAESGEPAARHAEILGQIAARGVPGYATRVLAAADLRRGHDDLVLLLAPGPGALAARELDLPVCLLYDPATAAAHRDADRVLSPTRAADATLARLGVAAHRIARWQPAVDRQRFSPAQYSASALPADTFCVLVAGDATPLVTAAFRRAREHDPRLRLVVVPQPDPRLYASADLLVSPATDDGFGHAVLAAQASGLPVLAIEGSGAAELIEIGRSGCVVAPDPVALGDAIRGLARRATLRERLATGGLMTARERTWTHALQALARCWDDARGTPAAEVVRAA